MIHAILKTDDKNLSYFLIRVMLAGVIFPHGAQKLFGIFGGYGFEGTMHYFTDTAGLPWVIGFLVILAESLGALMLAAGLMSRFVAASLVLIMAGAATIHLPNGFFMNWFGNQSGEGVEFFILAIAVGLQLTVHGGGKWSADTCLLRMMKQKNNSRLDQKIETSF